MRRHLTVLTLLILAALAPRPAATRQPSRHLRRASTVNGSIVSFANGGAGSQSSKHSSVSSVTVPAGIRITIVGTDITVDVSGDGTFS